jgi:hypothetical protein
MILFFIFRRHIADGWRRDMWTIIWPTQISDWICSWRQHRPVELIKIECTGSLTLRPRTCGRPIVFQPLGARNQSWALNFRSLRPCYIKEYKNIRLISMKNINDSLWIMKNSTEWSWYEIIDGRYMYTPLLVSRSQRRPASSSFSSAVSSLVSL